MKLISQFIICKGFIRFDAPRHRMMEQCDLDISIFQFLLNPCILPFPGHPEFTVFLFAVSPAAPDGIKACNTHPDAVDLHRGAVGQAITLLEQNRVAEII